MDISGKFATFMAVFVFLHLGCILAQNLGQYALTGQYEYGTDGIAILHGTPIADALAFGTLTSIFNLREVFTAMGDTLTGLFGMMTWDYEWLRGHEGAALWLVSIVRAAMGLVSGMVLLFLAQVLFNSGIFSSVGGLALVVGGTGITTLITSLLGS